VRFEPLLRQGLPRFRSSRAPLGRGEQVEDQSRSDGRQDAGQFDESTWTCSRRTPEPARTVTRAWMRAWPRPRGCPFLWWLSFGQAKESHQPPGMADETHTDVSRFLRNDEALSNTTSHW